MSDLKGIVNGIIGQLNDLKTSMNKRKTETDGSTQSILQKLKGINIDKLIEIIKKCCKNLKDSQEKLNNAQQNLQQSRQETQKTPELNNEIEKLKNDLNDKEKQLGDMNERIKKLNEEKFDISTNLNKIPQIIREIKEIVPTIPSENDMAQIDNQVNDLIRKVNDVKDCDEETGETSSGVPTIMSSIFGSPPPPPPPKEDRTKSIIGTNVLNMNQPIGLRGSVPLRTLTTEQAPQQPESVSDNLRKYLPTGEEETKENRETTGGKRRKPRKISKGKQTKKFSSNITNMMSNIAGSKKRHSKSKKMTIKTQVADNYAIAGKGKVLNISGTSSYLAGGKRHSKKRLRKSSKRGKSKTTTKKRKIMRKRKI